MRSGELPSAIALTSRDGRLVASFVPSAGMVCCSLRHDGEELLAQRAGLRAYAEHGSTMGIPLLYPWANRLASSRYACDDRVVELPAAGALVRRDANDLPIHGVVGSRLPWRLTSQGSTAGGACLSAELAWDSRELLELFPFPHRLAISAEVDRATLTVTTTLRAGPERPVPVSFGYHPYLTLPGSERDRWRVELPVTQRLALDARGIPTGELAPFHERDFTLGTGSWDDAFTGVIAHRAFAVSDARRRLELAFLDGYTHAQIFAPAGESFICFEPMTAATNALISHQGLRSLAPGQPLRATFRVSVYGGAHEDGTARACEEELESGTG